MKTKRRIFRPASTLPRTLGRTALGVGSVLLIGSILISLPTELAGRAAPMPERLVGAPGAVSVIDGDTLRLAGQVVRVRGIVGGKCEAGSECGARAISALSATVWDRQVQCVPQSRDEQGRPVVDCVANGADVAQATMARLASLTVRTPR